mmetsp:Transcript_26015/g.35843  ORF Transcript_26015/g.35843 Transcript_26015/m.35843 type:complete len:363 (-) Transcript_26015:716-1804(-)
MGGGPGLLKHGQRTGAAPGEAGVAEPVPLFRGPAPLSLPQRLSFRLLRARKASSDAGRKQLQAEAQPARDPVQSRGGQACGCGGSGGVGGRGRQRAGLVQREGQVGQQRSQLGQRQSHLAQRQRAHAVPTMQLDAGHRRRGRLPGPALLQLPEQLLVMRALLRVLRHRQQLLRSGLIAAALLQGQQRPQRAQAEDPLALVELLGGGLPVRVDGLRLRGGAAHQTLAGGGSLGLPVRHAAKHLPEGAAEVHRVDLVQVLGPLQRHIHRRLLCFLASHGRGAAGGVAQPQMQQSVRLLVGERQLHGPALRGGRHGLQLLHTQLHMAQEVVLTDPVVVEGLQLDDVSLAGQQARLRGLAAGIQHV